MPGGSIRLLFWFRIKKQAGSAHKSFRLHAEYNLNYASQPKDRCPVPHRTAGDTNKEILVSVLRCHQAQNILSNYKGNLINHRLECCKLILIQRQSKNKVPLQLPW